MPSTFTFPIAPQTAPSQTTPGLVTYSADAYTRMLKRLLPPGVALNLSPDSNITRVMQAFADELARVGERGKDLINESDPRTVSETLPEWEETLSLPDDFVTEIPEGEHERRLAITQKYTARGGQSVSFFTALCAACGWTLVSLTKYGGNGIFRAEDRVGDRVYGAAWAYAMTLTLTRGSSLSRTKVIALPLAGSGDTLPAGTTASWDETLFSLDADCPMEAIPAYDDISADPVEVGTIIVADNGKNYRAMTTGTPAGTSPTTLDPEADDTDGTVTWHYLNDVNPVASYWPGLELKDGVNYTSTSPLLSEGAPAEFPFNPEVDGAWNYVLGAGVTALDQDDLERVVRHATHSHIAVTFDYP